MKTAIELWLMDEIGAPVKNGSPSHLSANLGHGPELLGRGVYILICLP